jgi:hypothetical protein
MQEGMLAFIGTPRATSAFRGPTENVEPQADEPDPEIKPTANSR